MESTLQEIKQFYRQWYEAMEQADPKGILSLLDEDFYLKGPGQPALTDRSAFHDQLTRFHETYSETVEWDIEEVHYFKTKAVVRLSEKTTLTPHGEGEVLHLEGIHFAMLTRFTQGNWRLKTDVSSFNHPLPR